ncbi:unnamed protein product [Arabidopsis lyrata]|uniref:Predicted protein n=1 Tax=Arabidopsis lyrata subsp. lyrata TaxID=81972 RepID=D7KSP5_ARALL|nr:predicted protein [Arabidopsis lyrata subsp. lyrata]CAH8262930.1 unnamed protein product [Arabidopsis lyrata]
MCSIFWPCTSHLMDHGLNGHCLKRLCPGDRRPPPHKERDSLKSQGRGWPRGPTWRLGISAGNAKVATSRPADRRKRIN